MEKKATDSKAYRDFISERDQALEAIYLRAMHEANDVLRRAISRAVEIVAYRFGHVAADEMLTIKGRKNTETIDRDIAVEFSIAARHVAIVIEQMNVATFTLALVGEAEALGRALKDFTKYDVDRNEAERQSKEDAQGESVDGRVMLAFSRIRRDIMDAVELARVKGETTGEAIDRVKAAIPKPRKVARPKKKLAKVSEAAEPEWSEDFAQGFVSDDVWQKVISQIVEKYVPKWRGPESVFDVDVEGLTEEWYGWEIEQYLANEFVASVRSGEDTAAKQNGVVDMVWIAIVDDKTDECCLWRDGLTSTEIESKLRSGQHADDDCDSIVPPAHFNCRCRMAPLLDTQLPGEEFEKPASNAKEFYQWLNS